MKKTILITIASAVVASVFTILFFKTTGWEANKQTLKIEHVTSPRSAALFTTNAEGEIVPLDFTKVAEDVMSAVVHIKSTQVGVAGQTPYGPNPNPFRDFFGDDFFDQFFFYPDGRERNRGTPPARVGTGSGVLITDDGYIVTNNHVIANASDIEVTLHDNRTYKAKVVGTDPSTDLALIQIKENGLPFLPFGNSDEVKVGEWVLAVGNPFNLNSTVTAGIVSAKGRNINILPNQSAIESFIQTDAAINPGNSGGALVDMNGGLIGVNTAIASPTGAYAGYGFAVPAQMVEKVVSDLKKYGMVQRGYLGIMIRDVDGNLAREKDLDVTTGVYVDSLLENSAAKAAGLEKGDVILAVDGKEVKKAPELQELVARHRPGDKVSLKVDRAGEEKVYIVTLNNREGKTELLDKDSPELMTVLGAELEDLDQRTAQKLNIEGGVRVNKLYPGKLRQQTQMKEGFIITKLNQQTIRSVDQLIELLQNYEGGVMLEGVYEDIPGTYYYAFGL